MQGSEQVRELVAVNLRYDGGSAALYVRAMAQLLAKLLYAAGELTSRSPRELEREACRVLEISGIPMTQISEGLKKLEALHFARETKGRWQITKKGFGDINGDVERTRRRLESVISRHFPARLPINLLEPWFRDACVEFYKIYGSQWAAALARKAPRAPINATALKEVLTAATKKHGLVQDAEILETGFREFLSSEHTADVELNWSLGQSLLASQVVAAHVGPDPLTSDNFRNATLLIDTNVLFIIALGVHSKSAHIEALGKALSGINATLVVDQRTVDEYKHKVEHTRPEVLRAIASYQPQVWRGASDDFLRGAVEAGCDSREDFERFFDQLAVVPSELCEGVRISILDDAQIQQWAKEGESDEDLVRQINEAWNQHHERPKPKHAVNHDASLTRICERLGASGTKCSTLTHDRSMATVAAARSGDHGTPSWVMLDGLIQILAVDGSPSMNPTDFAPLMANLIRHQIEPIMNTYSSEDLAYLVDIENRCADLPADKIRSLAARVARLRYRGVQQDDKELQLIVRRAFQAGKMGLESELVDAKSSLRSQEELLKQTSKSRGVSTSAFLEIRERELRRNATWRLVGKSIGAFLVGLALSLAAVYLVFRVSPTGDLPERIQLLGMFMVPAFAAIGLIWKRFLPRWKKQTKGAFIAAEQELAEREARE